jgi:hypothetical protein
MVEIMHIYVQIYAYNNVQIASCALKILNLRYPQVGDISILVDVHDNDLEI